MEIKNILTTKVYISDKTKDGKPFITKAGKNYKKIAIQCKEYGNEYLSAFIFDERSELNNWREGETHKILVEKNGQYTNFRIPTRLDELEIRIERLENLAIQEEEDLSEVCLENSNDENIDNEGLSF